MPAPESVPDQPGPCPELSPRSVVKLQLEALRRNRELGDDAGIEIAFRFASEANREVTGPVERFARMLRNPLYKAMLDHSGSQLGPTHLEAGVARVQVVLFGRTGEVAAYDFTLSKDDVTECWLTDSVMFASVEMA